MLAVTLTEPQTLIFAPLVLWRFITAARVRPVMVAWGLGLAAQTWSYLVAPRSDTPGHPPWLSVAHGYVMESGLSVLTARNSIPGRLVAGAGWWVAYAWVGALFVFIGVGVRLAPPRVRSLLTTLVLGSVVAWTLAYVVNNNQGLYFSLMTPAELSIVQMVRWGTAASMMLAAAVAVTVAVVVAHRPRLWWAGLSVLGLMTATMATDFAHARSYDVPSWSDQVERGLQECATDPVLEVRTAPQPFAVEVPCDRVLE